MRGAKVGVAAEGGGAGGGGAVAFVAELDGDGEGGALGVAGEAVDAIVARGGVALGVDGGVAETVALGDDEAARGALVEGGGEAGDVEPRAVLGRRDELVVDDGGGGQGEVGGGEEARVCPRGRGAVE